MERGGQAAMQAKKVFNSFIAPSSHYPEVAPPSRKLLRMAAKAPLTIMPRQPQPPRQSHAARSPVRSVHPRCVRPVRA